MDINQLNLSIIRDYIEKSDKNNYKILFFIIKKVFREEIIKEDYISITLNKISIVPNRISIVLNKISTVPTKISTSSS